MVNDLRTFLYPSLFRRVSSVAITGACIVSIFPRPLVCSSVKELPFSEFISNSIGNTSDDNSDHLARKFDQLEEVFQLTENPRLEICQFIQTVIQEVNAKYGLDLTTLEACHIVRNNLSSLQIPIKVQDVLLETIRILESSSNLHEERANDPLNALKLEVSWPWHWNWFGLNKKKHKEPKKCHSKPLRSAPLIQEISNDEQLPGTVYVGAVEAFAGALVFILGFAFPPAYGVGSALMVDGTRRVLNGLEEIDKRSFPNPNRLLAPPNQ